MNTQAVEGSTLMSVHVVSTYPVYWTRFAVLRDFLQNFFDSTGPAKFGKCVKIQATGDELCFSTRDAGFALDWLTHIGASTKTGSAAGEHAGYFGEGFKVAALCAVRDFGWSVSMGSQDWSASVELADERIGETAVRVLAYRVAETNPHPGETWVRLGRLTKADHALADEVRLCFDFRGNPVVGEKLCASSSITVSRATVRLLRRDLPFVGHRPGPGTLFLAYQARASLPFPLVISLRAERTAERDRPTLYDSQVVGYVNSAAFGMSPEVAVEVLGYLRAHWRGSSPRQFSFGSWTTVVSTLIRRIETSSDAVTLFRKQWPDLYVRTPVPRGDIAAGNRQRLAFAWMRAYVADYTVVQPEFARLGYPTIEAACQAAGGYPRPAPRQRVHEERIALLQAFVERELAPLLSRTGAPQVQVLDLRGCGWAGVAEVIPCREIQYSDTGRRLRRVVRTVSLSAHALSASSPASALATYVHECCHAFGRDESASFSAALTDVIELLAVRGDPFATLHDAWSAVGEE